AHWRSEMDFVFGLPAKGRARRPWPDAEQHPCIPFEGAGTEIAEGTEELGADPVVLRPPGIEPGKAARLAVSLETRLDRSAERDARLPGIKKSRPPRGIGADIGGQEQVDGIDRVEDLLAKDRAEGGFVGGARQGAPAELGKEARIQPIL